MPGNSVEKIPSEDPNALIIDNGSFSWTKDSQNTILKNISLKVPKGALVAVIGRVGSGKSSLIAAFLREIHKLEGKVQVSGSLAYMSQGSWIRNQTIRDNVLFNSKYNVEEYNNAVYSAALVDDLKIFPNGD